MQYMYKYNTTEEIIDRNHVPVQYFDSSLDVGEYIENRILKIESVFTKLHFLAWGFNLVRGLFFVVVFVLCLL